MTAPLPQQTVTVKDPSVRKRRRRAPAGGATDDCFSCSKKGLKCDRRRPYCSQCLEVGTECSGYKTQLTWGVGVASRGKLRGLSLPVAKSPPVAREPKKMSSSRSRSSSAVTIQGVDQDDVSRAPIDIPMASQVASAPTTPYGTMGYDYMSMSHHESTPPMPQGSWGSIAYSPGMGHTPDGTPKFSRFTLPLVTEGLSSSVESLNEVEYLSPMSQSFSREDLPYVHSPTLMYDPHGTTNTSPSPNSPPASLYMDQHSRTMGPTSCPTLVNAPTEPASNLHPQMDQFDSNISQELIRNNGNFSVPKVDAYGTTYTSRHLSTALEEDIPPQWSDTTTSSRHWPTAAEKQPIHMSQDAINKMPFFMDYYEKIMCPSMVFIDGPNNPFRKHVLHLAEDSQSIRHAICALASCNLRMKKRLRLGVDGQQEPQTNTVAVHTAEAMADSQSDEQRLSEEHEHRNVAVHLLNTQLNDPNNSTHDSALATILLLCHYRMVESGIAKFHTQFAGVSKLLALRSSRSVPSRDSAWMEAIFTYFDTISANINDRDIQLGTIVVGDGPGTPSLPVGTENLVGCDRELVKIISQLGRLNLLSQSRPVRNPASSPMPRAGVFRHASPSCVPPLGHAYKGKSVVSNAQQGQQVRPSVSLSDQGLGDRGETLFSGASTAPDSERTVFWREWREARVALQNWQFDASRVSLSLPVSPTADQLRDLCSLSEAFRHAALLYTERLVSPSLSSNHQSFQDLVNQVIYHISNMEMGSTAEKFLLWPLFVAGSECVHEMQQNFVRSKCRDIMSRSGYMNNLAALEALEKVWSDGSSGMAMNEERTRGQTQRGPFNWMRCIGGPGIEEEWIMF